MDYVKDEDAVNTSLRVKDMNNKKIHSDDANGTRTEECFYILYKLKQRNQYVKD